jgi:hypothetical protein
MASKGKTTIVPTAGPNKTLPLCTKIEINFVENIMQVFYGDLSGPKVHQTELTSVNSVSWTQP